MQETARAALLCTTLAITFGIAHGQSAYQSGKIVKIIADQRSETAAITPPQDDSETNRSTVYPQYGTVYYVSIRGKQALYVAEIRPGTSGFDPASLTSGSELQFRTSGQMIYLKNAAGAEVPARLVKMPKVAKPSSQSDQKQQKR